MTHRKLLPGRLAIASHNAGKVREINELISPFGLEAVSAAALSLIAPAETETSFAGNAAIKARSVSEASGLVALADDSGLEVEALDGAPGVWSADWAEREPGGVRDFDFAMERVREALAILGRRESPARFVCCLALAWPDGHLETFEGEVRGSVSFPARGKNGFGYDPIFTAVGDRLTFGELDPTIKNLKSHRADAFRKLKDACLE